MGLGQHFPRGVQVGGQGFFVEFELVQARQQRGVGQRGIAQATPMLRSTVLSVRSAASG